MPGTPNAHAPVHRPPCRKAYHDLHGKLTISCLSQSYDKSSRNSSRSHREWSTCMCFVQAIGRFGPPGFLFHRDSYGGFTETPLNCYLVTNKIITMGISVCIVQSHRSRRYSACSLVLLLSMLPHNLPLHQRANRREQGTSRYSKDHNIQLECLCKPCAKCHRR